MDITRATNTVTAMTDKTKKISSRDLDPHYTDKRFDNPQTIFLDPGFETEERFRADVVKGAEYVYSDRLVQWHSIDKCNQALANAKAVEGEESTPKLYETYLQILMDKPNLRLIHIISGVNVGNGYPYRVYGYIQEEE
ncbi:MAG: hypothetical protein WD552_02480 [Candidatus Paceibacterota bacterium]